MIDVRRHFWVLPGLFLAAALSVTGPVAIAQPANWSLETISGQVNPIAGEQKVVSGTRGNKVVNIACGAKDKLLSLQYSDLVEAINSATFDDRRMSKQKYALVLLSYHGDGRKDHHAQMDIGGVRLFRSSKIGIAAGSDNAPGGSARIKDFLTKVLASSQPLDRLVVALIDDQTDKLVVRTEFAWGERFGAGRNELRRHLQSCLSPQAIQSPCDQYRWVVVDGKPREDIQKKAYAECRHSHAVAAALAAAGAHRARNSTELRGPNTGHCGQLTSERQCVKARCYWSRGGSECTDTT